jgi:hypothetical protein
MPPLQALAGTSVLAPAAIALTAIRDALDAQAPRNLSGKPQNPVSKLLSDAQLTFSVARGPLAVSGQPNVLLVTTPLSGQFEALGTLTGAVGSGVSSVGSTLGSAIGGSVGQRVQSLAGKAFDQHADIYGTVTTASRPTIASNWRLAPNLSGQVNVVDVVLPIGDLKLSVASAVKPALDSALRDQMSALENRLRNDPFIENAARGEWAKLCHSISLGAAAQGMPIFGLKSARSVPSRRSRRSTAKRSRFWSACRRKRISCRTRPSRSVHFRKPSIWYRRRARVASASRC